MSKKRILFVDDEPNILSGLRRMLRPMRHQWVLAFADSGREALKVMAEEPFDVVVSDMRMPGMDGAELLTLIQETYPHAIRIMLTGHADEKAILRTVGVVHQFLSKPCSPEQLKAVLDRATALHDLITNDQLKILISRLGSLPSLPSLYADLQRLLRDPDSSIQDVAHLIEQDLAMSAKVLQLVNSAFFGLYKTIDSPSRAVNLLGLDTIKALVLGVQVFTELKTTSSFFSVDALWEHSLKTGRLAREIAISKSDNRELADNSFIAGILHDIGKLILLSTLPDQFEQAVRLAGEREICLHMAEKEIFQASHDDVGAYLLGLWGLPSPVIEAIGFHHRLSDFPEESFSPALAVHIADVLYHQNNGSLLPGCVPELDEAYLDRLGLAGQGDQWQGFWNLLEERSMEE
ncbi:two-component system response regulator [Desulfolithobacter dissulfuricans]|uniref:Two-component system response regulator n=1 Tax=Desulfolithobacter dissulfuricans TaxID=2795293 RepID=A0A915XGS0_9BACT|nr:response regulator [Desulfolithobacter dissulfuricans]BCO07774.1 two-component system response regulator [Desulfolithobacter dissulfuricans]